MFSIIMPYYKNSHTVNRSIDSVIAQSYKNFELIIIDDGSKDNINDIVKSYNDNRINLIIKDNGGVSSARNLGILNSKYDYICFLDSDDEYDFNHLQVMFDFTQRFTNFKMFVTGHMRRGASVFNSIDLINFDGKNQIIIDNYFKFSINKAQLIHTNSVCIHKDITKKVGLFEVGVNRGEDTDLWCRISLFFDIVFINQATTYYNRDSNTLTQKLDSSFRWVFLTREKEIMSLPIKRKKRKSLKIFLMRAKISEIRNIVSCGDIKLARKSLIKVIPHWSILISYIVTFFIVFLSLGFGQKIVNRVKSNRFRKY